MEDVKTTPAPSPANILEPSKYITQLEYVLYSLGSSASVHSATKSANTWDFIARRGLYAISNGKSLIAHLAMRPVASRLFMMSLSGTSEATVAVLRATSWALRWFSLEEERVVQ